MFERVKQIKWLLVVGLIVRLPLMFQSLWYDEAFTRLVAQQSPARLIDATAGDVHPPLWYLIEWLTVRIAGDSEFALRLPALVFGLLTIWLMYGVLAKLSQIPDMVKTLALWFVALSPMLIRYSAEARMYSLAVVLVLWSIENALARRYAWLGLSIALGMYTSNMFALYIPVIIIIAAACPEPAEWVGSRRPALSTSATLSTSLSNGSAVGSLAIAGLLYLPWLPSLWDQVQNVGSAYWILPLNFGRISYIVYRLIAGPGKFEFAVFITGPLLLAAVLAGSGLAWRSAGKTGKTGKIREVPGHFPDFSGFSGAKVVVLWAWFPIVLGAVISSIFAPVLIERVVLGSVPALMILVAWASVWIYQNISRWHLLPITGALALAVFAVIATPSRSDVLSKYSPVPVEPGDYCYHINASSLIVAEYALPECNNYLWPANHTLEQSITGQTKNALGMKQQPIDTLIGRVWLFHYTGPHVQTPEYAEQRRILNRYPALNEIPLDDGEIATTIVWELELNNELGKNH